VAMTSSTSPRRALASTYAAQAAPHVTDLAGLPEVGRKGNRRYRLIAVSLGPRRFESTPALPRVCRSEPIRPVKLARMFAKPLCCHDSLVGAEA